MQFENGKLNGVVNDLLGGGTPGLAPVVESAPVMTTPATVATTPEDVALATAVVNASAAALNYAHAVHS